MVQLDMIMISSRILPVIACKIVMVVLKMTSH